MNCTHPMDERFIHDFGPTGHLNMETGRHKMCGGCGADLGAAAPLPTCTDCGGELVVFTTQGGLLGWRHRHAGNYLHAARSVVIA